MERKELQKVLDRFRLSVISQSKRNLTQMKKNSSKQLYNSIKGTVKAYPNSFSMEFSMQEYGLYVDEGVKGNDPSQISPNAKIKGQQAPNSRFKFGSGSHSGTWDKFTRSIELWAKKKNIRLRDEKGKYKKGNYKTISQIIAKNIYSRGLRPSWFFTKPFEAAYKNLPDEMVEGFGLDIAKLFDQSTQNVIKNG
jgi:hypothetical protein